MSVSGTFRLAGDVGGGEGVQGAAHGLRHLRRAPRVHHRVGDAAHQILAEADLRIHKSARGDHFAGLQIAQVPGDSRRADVDGESIDVLVQSRPDTDDLRVAVHGDGYFPVALAQRGLQALQYRQIAAQARQLPLTFQRLGEPLQIPGRIVHVRLAHFHVIKTRHRVEGDRPCLGGLAHHLAVHLAARGHIDDEVAFDLRLAGEPVAVGQRATAGVTLFGLAQGREVSRC